MENISEEIINKKLTEFIESIDNDNLRGTIRQRLKRNSHLVVGAILVDENERICLIQEAKAPYSGKWNLPIGHLDHNETMITGAKREVKEETGYDIELTAMLPPQNASCENVFRILYIGKVIGGSSNDRIQGDTSAVGWFTIDEIEQKFKNNDLRDAGTWHDILLYQSNTKLPLDIIKEVKYQKLTYNSQED